MSSDQKNSEDSPRRFGRGYVRHVSSRFSALDLEQQQQSSSSSSTLFSLREPLPAQSHAATAPLSRSQRIWPPPQLPSDDSSRSDSSQISRGLNGSPAVAENALKSADITISAAPSPTPVQKRPPPPLPPRPKRNNSTIATVNVPDKSTQQQQPVISETGLTLSNPNPPNGNLNLSISNSSEDASPSSSRRGLVAARKQLFESLRETAPGESSSSSPSSSSSSSSFSTSSSQRGTSTSTADTQAAATVPPSPMPKRSFTSAPKALSAESNSSTTSRSSNVRQAEAAQTAATVQNTACVTPVATMLNQTTNANSSISTNVGVGNECECTAGAMGSADWAGAGAISGCAPSPTPSASDSGLTASASASLCDGAAVALAARPARPLQPPGHPMPPTPPTSRRKLGVKLLSASDDLSNSFASPPPPPVPTQLLREKPPAPEQPESESMTPTPKSVSATAEPTLGASLVLSGESGSSLLPSRGGGDSDVARAEAIADSTSETASDASDPRASVRTLVSAYDRNFGTVERKKVSAPHRLAIRNIHERSFEESISNPSTPASESASSSTCITRLVDLGDSDTGEAAAASALVTSSSVDPSVALEPLASIAAAAAVVTRDGEALERNRSPRIENEPRLSVSNANCVPGGGALVENERSDGGSDSTPSTAPLAHMPTCRVPGDDSPAAAAFDVDCFRSPSPVCGDLNLNPHPHSSLKEQSSASAAPVDADVDSDVAVACRPEIACDRSARGGNSERAVPLPQPQPTPLLLNELISGASEPSRAAIDVRSDERATKQETGDGARVFDGSSSISPFISADVGSSLTKMLGASASEGEAVLTSAPVVPSPVPSPNPCFSREDDADPLRVQPEHSASCPQVNHMDSKQHVVHMPCTTSERSPSTPASSSCEPADALKMEETSAGRASLPSNNECLAASAPHTSNLDARMEHFSAGTGSVNAEPLHSLLPAPDAANSQCSSDMSLCAPRSHSDSYSEPHSLDTHLNDTFANGDGERTSASELAAPLASDAAASLITARVGTCDPNPNPSACRTTSSSQNAAVAAAACTSATSELPSAPSATRAQTNARSEDVEKDKGDEDDLNSVNAAAHVHIFVAATGSADSNSHSHSDAVAVADADSSRVSRATSGVSVCGFGSDAASASFAGCESASGGGGSARAIESLSAGRCGSSNANDKSSEAEAEVALAVQLETKQTPQTTQAEPETRATPRCHPPRPPLRVEHSLTSSEEPEPDEDEPEPEPEPDLPHRPPPPPVAQPEPDVDADVDTDCVAGAGVSVDFEEQKALMYSPLSSARPLTFGPRARTAPLPVALPHVPAPASSVSLSVSASKSADVECTPTSQHPPSDTPISQSTALNGHSSCDERTISGMGVAEVASASTNECSALDASRDASNQSAAPQKGLELLVNVRASSRNSNDAPSTNSFGLPGAIAAHGGAGELTPDSLLPSPCRSAPSPAPDYCSSGPRYIDFGVLMRSTSSASSTCSTTSNNSWSVPVGLSSVTGPDLEPDPRIYGKRFAATARPRLLLSDLMDVTDTVAAPDSDSFSIARPTDGNDSDEDDDEDDQVIEADEALDSPDGESAPSTSAAGSLLCSLPLNAFQFVGAGVRVGKSVLRSASGVSASTPAAAAEAAVTASDRGELSTSASSTASAPLRKRLAFTERAADVFEYPSERFLLNLPADYDFSTLERDCAEAAEREECAARERRARTMAPVRASHVMSDSLLLDDDVGASSSTGSLPQPQSPALSRQSPSAFSRESPPPPPLLDVEEEAPSPAEKKSGTTCETTRSESLESGGGGSCVTSPASVRPPVPSGSALNELNGTTSKYKSEVAVFAMAKPLPDEASFDPDWGLGFVDSDTSENENADPNDDAISEDDPQLSSGSPRADSAEPPAAPADKTPSLVASPDCNSVALIRPPEVDV